MKNSSSSTETAMRQQCTLTSLYIAVLGFSILYAGGAVYLAFTRNWPALLGWLVLLPCARWAGLRLSPYTSRLRGQELVEDKLPAAVNKAHVEVVFYTHNGCPFCPIVKRRLDALQKEMGFSLTKIDLSFTPQLAASKGIQSVPVVEVGKDRPFGNVTTEQLAQLIAGAQTPETIMQVSAA